MTKQDNPQGRYWIHTGRELGSSPYPIPESDRHVQTNVAIKTQDGVTLRGDLYVPQGAGPFPAIVEITPYGCHGLARLGHIYAGRGYLFLAVDCRGRYRSGGDWEPLTHDRDDGHAVLAWIAEHELCNGRVGTRGHSYSGYNQLLAAVDAPPCLQAMVVGVAPGDPFYNTPFQGGCYDLNDLFWLLDMTGRVSVDREADAVPDDEDDTGTEKTGTEEEDAEYDELFELALSRRPFVDADLRLGMYHPTFREWVAHWRLDDYWRQRSVLPGIERTVVPTLHISGWWDGNGRGATQFFTAMRDAARTERARTHQRLLLGPWNHDLRAPDCDALPEHERALIARGALRDSLNDEMAWFDEHLKDLPPSTGCGARVSLYLTGAHHWIEAADWPLPEARETTFYLEGGERGLPGVLSSNRPLTAKAVSYEMHPDDPTPYADTAVDAERMPFDNTAIQAERRDLLLYDTPSLETALALVGPVAARVYAAANTPDFDVVASLYDVYPDGRSIFLTDGVLRARFHRGFDRPETLIPGAVYELVIDMWHVGHVLRPGHKLRLQLASAAHLRFDVNPGTGGDLAHDQDQQPVRVQIFLGPDHPSSLIVPVLDLQGRS